jgi:hypothetical protein
MLTAMLACPPLGNSKIDSWVLEKLLLLTPLSLCFSEFLPPHFCVLPDFLDAKVRGVFLGKSV